MIWTAVSAVASPAVSHLTTEGLVEPALVDATSPRFSWRLMSPARGARQVAYQLRVTPLGADGQPAKSSFETPRTASSRSQWIEVPDFVPQPKTPYR